MKSHLLIFGIILFAFASCKPKQEITKKTNDNERINRYFPEILGDLVCNLPREEVIAKRPNLASINYVNDAFSFRKEFVEDINAEGIKKIIYYFDTDNHKPFYETIIVYDNEKKRDEEATRLLGPPNSENATEWELNSRQGYIIKAWKFENKLVLAAQIKGTEWEE